MNTIYTMNAKNRSSNGSKKLAGFVTATTRSHGFLRSQKPLWFCVGSGSGHPSVRWGEKPWKTAVKPGGIWQGFLKDPFKE